MKVINKIIIVSLLVCFTTNAFAQYEKLHAAFIYNFTKYLEWPAASRSGDFFIGVVNNPEMVSALNAMVSGKLVGSQKIVVKTFNSVNEINNCHILYLPENLAGEVGSAKGKIGGQSTLLVTVGAGVVQKGADISFILTGDKLNFELNKGNVTGKNITVSSRLEQLAAKVY